MTEGIIQEVFKKHWKIQHDLGNTTSALEQLQQELLEKIKQEFPENEDAYLNYRIRKALIGDNK